MDNIFENVKFGDKFLTRDNKISLYIGISDLYDKLTHACYIENNGVTYYDANGVCVFPNKQLDIISRYKEPIDEDKLDELVKEFIKQNSDGIHQLRATTSFKAGYRKAKEE